MEYCEVDEKGESVENIKFETIQIEQDKTKYDLNIEVKDNMIIFSIKDKSVFPSVNYIRSMNFSDLIDLNKAFNFLNSFHEFYKFLKTLSDKKSINIEKNKNKISIIFNVEILLEKNKIVIDLFEAKKEVGLDIKEIYQELSNIKGTINILTKDNQSLKEDNKKLNEDINKLKNKMKN